MKFNANPKLLWALGAAVAIFLYMNVFSGDSSAPAPPPVARTGVTPAVPAATREKARRSANRGGAVEFKIRQGDPEGHVDPTKIDPTLRLDLLAKVQNVQPEEAVRNLFQYGVPVAAVATAKPTTLPTNVPKIMPTAPRPPGPPPPPPGPPPPPSPPKMTFKYYGYKVSKASGRKEAFLLDGDDIFIAGENDPVKGPRYRVVRIGVNSITIEDTQFKASQTIPLQEEPAA